MDNISEENNTNNENYLVLNTTESSGNIIKNKKIQINNGLIDVIDKKQNIEIENISRKQKEAIINRKKIKLEKFMNEIELKEDYGIPSSFTPKGNPNEKDKDVSRPCCNENECLIY
jgi:hypothetical protein